MTIENVHVKRENILFHDFFFFFRELLGREQRGGDREQEEHSFLGKNTTQMDHLLLSRIPHPSPQKTIGPSGLSLPCGGYLNYQFTGTLYESSAFLGGHTIIIGVHRTAPTEFLEAFKRRLAWRRSLGLEDPTPTSDLVEMGFVAANERLFAGSLDEDVIASLQASAKIIEKERT